MCVQIEAWRKSEQQYLKQQYFGYPQTQQKIVSQRDNGEIMMHSLGLQKKVFTLEQFD